MESSSVSAKQGRPLAPLSRWGSRGSERWRALPQVSQEDSQPARLVRKPELLACLPPTPCTPAPSSPGSLGGAAWGPQESLSCCPRPLVKHLSAVTASPIPACERDPSSQLPSPGVLSSYLCSSAGSRRLSWRVSFEGQGRGVRWGEVGWAPQAGALNWDSGTPPPGDPRPSQPHTPARYQVAGSSCPEPMGPPGPQAR